jgi:oligoendopeptidase F
LGQEYTLAQAKKFLESPERAVRKEVYELMQNTMKLGIDAINIVLDEMIIVRNQIAKNAGFADYVNYSYANYGRFDYGEQEVMEFHRSVEKIIKPLYIYQLEKRKERLWLTILQPFDLMVDPRGKKALQVFADEQQAIDRTIACLDKMDPEFWNVLREMQDFWHFDLESRKGKRGGAFISRSQYETKIPYMFGNLVGTIRDMTTMIHESGHAIHGKIMHETLPSQCFCRSADGNCWDREYGFGVTQYGFLGCVLTFWWRTSRCQAKTHGRYYWIFPMVQLYWSVSTSTL